MSENKKKSKTDVPNSLRTWFLIHFVTDIIFAVPLIFAPTWTLSLFGFPVAETLTARLVGAALIGIGGVSFLVRDKSKEVFDALLSLKIIWSLAALLAIVLSIVNGAPATAWILFIIFAAFNIVWTHYKKRLK